MEIKTLCSLRSLREIYYHHTDVLFSHAEDAKVAKNLLNNTCDRERSLATHDKRAQRYAEISSCIVYSFVIQSLRSPVAVKLATTPAPA